MWPPEQKQLVLTVVALLTAFASAAEPPLEEGDLPHLPALEPREALAAFKGAPGFRIELAAAEPEVLDPVAIAFDENGALFVVEMRDYSERRAEKLSRVRRLVDEDGDGRFEKATVFLEALAWATGIVCSNGGVIVAASPDLIYARDTTGDGVADERRVVLTGFGEGLPKLNVQALVNSLTFGPDNRIWGATAGNGGRVNGVRIDGADFSFDPGTFSLSAETGTAQFGLTFDTGGRRFVCSNSSHLRWVAIERRYVAGRLYRPEKPLVDIPVDGPAAEVFRLSPEEPWRVVRTRWRASGAVPGIVEGGGRASGYFTSASGLAVYTGDLLPGFAEQVFVGDVGSNLVHRKHLRETPDGPVAERDSSEAASEFLASRDTWFRPVACANGPDGALYIIDMYREVIEHPDSLPPGLKRRIDLNSGNNRGRLYRIVPAEAAPRRRTALGALNSEALAALTGHPNGWHRVTARRLLVERHDLAAVSVLRSIDSFDALSALEGLGALTAHDLRRSLESPDDRVQCLALRLLEKHPDQCASLEPMLAALADSPSPAVRRQWALSLGRLTVPHRTTHLARLWSSRQSRSASVQPQRPADPSSEFPRLREAIRLAIGSGREAFELLRLVPEPDAEIVRMIGRSGDAAAIAETAAWLQNSLEEKRETLFGLIAALGDRAAMDNVREPAIRCLLEATAEAHERLAAASLLARDATASANQALEQVFFDSKTPEPVRLAALGAIGDSATARLWGAWPRMSSALRMAVLERAVARAAWHAPLLDAVAAGQIGALELGAAQAQQLRTAADPAVREKAVAVLGPPPPSRQSVIEQHLPALKLSGDAARGEIAYRLRCLTCHRLGNEGAEVGPERVTFRNLGKPTLLVHLLDPNREVAPRFLAASVTTTTGETWQGLLRRDDQAGVSIRLAGGRDVDVERAQIASFSTLNRSLMPEGLEAGLTDADLADLLEFLVK